MNLKQTVTDSNVATGCSAYFHANVDTIFEDMFRSIIIEVLIKAILAEATKWLLWVLCLGVLEIPRLYVNPGIGELRSYSYVPARYSGHTLLVCLYDPFFSFFSIFPKSRSGGD